MSAVPMKKAKEKANKVLTSMIMEVIPSAVIMVVAVLLFFYFVTGISHDHPAFDMRDAKGRKVELCITPEDHLSLLYMVILTGGVTMVNFLTQGLKLFVVEAVA